MDANGIDLGSVDFLADPYPTYRRLLETETPFWLAHDGTNRGMWLVSRYSDAARLLKEAHTTKSVPQGMPGKPLPPFGHSMLSKDPPEHTRLRALVNLEFTLRRAGEMAPRIAWIADELIAQLEGRDDLEFMSEFALPLASTVITDLLGVPYEDRDAFCAWSNTMVTGFDDVNRDIDTRQIREATSALSDYLADLIRRRRQEPRDDVISGLILARDHEERLSEEELLAMCVLLLIAGFETSANLLGNGMMTLLKHPAQMTLLKGCPDLLPQAIEEMLRFESPIQRTTFRVMAESMEVGGVTLHKGQQVTAVIGAANRDPGQFAAPDLFDITRQPNRHLAFGLGIHFCLGAPLVRTVARIAIARLLAQLPDLRLATTVPNWRKNSALRGLVSLPMMF